MRSVVQVHLGPPPKHPGQPPDRRALLTPSRGTLTLSARAVPPHPPAGGPHRHAPPLTAPATAARPSSRRAIMSPRKPAVKGAPACGLRVPPLRSAQTLDSDLPRQDLAPGGRTGKDGPAPLWLAGTPSRPGRRRGPAVGGSDV